MRRPPASFDFWRPRYRPLAATPRSCFFARTAFWLSVMPSRRGACGAKIAKNPQLHAATQAESGSVEQFFAVPASLNSSHRPPARLHALDASSSWPRSAHSHAHTLRRKCALELPAGSRHDGSFTHSTRPILRSSLEADCSHTTPTTRPASVSCFVASHNVGGLEYSCRTTRSEVRAWKCELGGYT